MVYFQAIVSDKMEACVHCHVDVTITHVTSIQKRLDICCMKQTEMDNYEWS